MVHEVFISYSSKDKQIADAACAYLEHEGISCWIAPRNIEPGRVFHSAIVDAIIQSPVMVLIFSSNSNESPHVLREVSLACENNIIIVPFRIEALQPHKNIEWLISSPHWLDAITPPVENHLLSLAKSVKHILGTEFHKDEKTGYASFADRCVAEFIDILIIVLMYVLVVIGITIMNKDFLALNSSLVPFGIFALFWGYHAFFESSKLFATPGKKVMGIFIADTNGKKISPVQSAIRSFVKIFSIVVLGIGVFMMIWSEKKQGFHDYVANTVVMKKRAL
jgi:uncharacterized RDD family membrane protein YckC